MVLHNGENDLHPKTEWIKCRAGGGASPLSDTDSLPHIISACKEGTIARGLTMWEVAPEANKNFEGNAVYLKCGQLKLLQNAVIQDMSIPS